MGTLCLDRPRHAGVQRDEHVKALRLTDLTDDDPPGPHPQGLLDQAAEVDLTGAFEARLAALQGNEVPVLDPQLEDFLAGDDAFAGWDRAGEGVQHRRLPGNHFGPPQAPVWSQGSCPTDRRIASTPPDAVTAQHASDLHERL